MQNIPEHSSIGEWRLSRILILSLISLRIVTCCSSDRGGTAYRERDKESNDTITIQQNELFCTKRTN